MATASTLSISVSNRRLIAGSSKLANPISSSSSKPSSFPLSSYPSSSSLSNAGSFGSVSTSRRRLVELGIGLLAFSAPMLDANATRIEYYATVGEPLCDLKSGLGFCDVAVGNGVQVPGGELINVNSCLY